MINEAWFPVALTLLAAVVGFLLGGAGARLLGRLRVPAPVPVYGCAALAGLLWTVAALRVSSGALPVGWLAVSCAAGLLTVLAAATDLAHRRLPDLLTLRAPPILALLLIFAAWAAADGGVLIRAVLGGLGLAALYASVHLASPRALGAGDVKLAMVVGMILASVSWASWLLAAVITPLLTGLLGLAVALRRGGRVSIPHGPSMLIPAWLLVTFQP
ncbi:prepilin peptidase [Actinoalloteichus hymeniacidonis]|uniref:Type IV leader peptidase n=1 Tax=Actinoalloteichus hymeniacidonis TaxID=340345 RepID=A0AAC9HQF8_9PSEU|nr:prepilin peptidase [Actinoalloteichus hymeniacidonis]AOS63096.1 type IV leader peptidase [Actinoalloteichus hymeniacidonis]MBB5908868.1 leader peptidase (prepilin peptidase)/N-methyltransferase [Actinoalloteichus hymeniacidonis]